MPDHHEHEHLIKRIHSHRQKHNISETCPVCSKGTMTVISMIQEEMVERGYGGIAGVGKLRLQALACDRCGHVMFFNESSIA
jgi:hypothetical protein